MFNKLFGRAIKKFIGIGKSKRNLGGKAHHHPSGPYDVKHHPIHANEAYVFGIEPGKYKFEGWEYITLFTYVTSFLMLTVGMSSKEGETFTVTLFFFFFLITL